MTCGEHWTAGSVWDGTYGVGQQMSALSVVQSNLINESVELVTNTTGGTSQGNAAAGTISGIGSGESEIVATSLLGLIRLGQEF